MNLSIDKFNPMKAEITTLVENIKSTVIIVPGDKAGYELMKESKKTLQSKRLDVVEYLKNERAGALAFQKGIIAVEKDVLAIIEPVESDLDKAIKEIDDAEKREKRTEVLPERKAKLATINIEISDDEILDMDEKKFADFFVEKRMAYLEAKEQKIKDEEEMRNVKIKAEADAKQREIEMEQAKKDAAIQATKEAEQKAEKEKQAIIDENNRKERERIAGEERLKIEEENRIKKEQEEKGKLEKRKKYQKFRADNGYTEETKDDFYEQNTGDKIILFKKVGEFKL